MKSKNYAKAFLKAEPQNRAAEIGDIVQWINPLQETFYAMVTDKNQNEVGFRNFYPTDNPHYCFTSDNIERLIVLKLYLKSDDKVIGTVSKNVIDAFLKNEIKLDEAVWYETKNAVPRIHRKNLICKI